ncbi:hypothetical protein DAEQUDRAFT_766544 [Daedalea quercina L-15889]|uniref:Uncharacterized protein n=1 Tax=Daedalea quercina L-15889 TaxID=1314783 RepID=A0A165PFP0_9APHY|nr:hypothetical protein DAEQUDRAFT_766544 [Daedalea quercina L-15889]
MSPRGSRPSSSGTVVGRERSISGANATAVPRRQGSLGSERMHDKSSSTPVAPGTPAELLDGRSRPILLASRVQTNGVRSQASPSSSMPPPPLPLMPPPPVPPSSSQSDAAKTTKPPPQELSYTEKRDLWVERIKMLTDATIARAEHMRLTQEVEKYQRMVRSARYSSISEEDQARLNAQLSDVTGRLNAKKEELNAVLPRLIDADFWGATVNSPPKLDEFRKEVQNVIAELSKNIQRLYDQYEELRTNGINASGTPMAVDTPGLQAHEGPPAKRRRLSSGETTLAINGDDQKLHGIPSGEIGEIRDRVLEMEGRVADLENEIVERDHNLLEEVEDLVAQRMEEEQRKPKTEARPKSPAPVSQPPLPTPNIKRIEDELATTGNQVEELANEVANLITQMAARDQEHAQLAKENQLLREHIAALEKQQTAASEANKAEIQALSAAVQSYISQAPAQASPPPPPPLQQVPSIDEILTKVHPPLIQTLHEDMEPLLRETHQTIQTLLQDQLNNVYGTLVSKMTPTMKTVDVVAQWMDRVRRGEPFVDNPVQSHNAQ